MLYFQTGGVTIETLTQENRGFSGARNRALEKIKATYILFLDSDDILPPNTIELMINTAKAKEPRKNKSRFIRT